MLWKSSLMALSSTSTSVAVAKSKPLPIFKTAFSTLTAETVLGNGGSGRVYRCVDQEGGVWAVKVLDPKRATREKLKRFKNEYVFASQHPHSNLVGVADSGVVVLDG